MPNVHTGSLFKKIINKLTGEVTSKEPVLIKTAAKVVFRESGKTVEETMGAVETTIGNHATAITNMSSTVDSHEQSISTMENSINNNADAITELQKITFRIENGVLIATSNP